MHVKKTNVFLQEVSKFFDTEKSYGYLKPYACGGNESKKFHVDILNNIKAVAIIFVVFYHLAVYFDADRYTFNEVFVSIRKIIGALGVPSFFFISGFLFFNSTKVETFKFSFAGKIKKRLKTLLIPYLFWNLFGISLGIFYVKSGLATEKSYFWDFNLFEFIWNSKGDLPLWYIKYLFVMNLFSPIFYMLFSKHVNFWIKRFLLCTILFAFLLLYHVYYAYTLALWFVIGAFFAIEKIDFINLAAKYFYTFLFMYTVSSAVYLYLHFFKNIDFSYNSYVLIFGVPFFFGLMARFKIKISDTLVRNSFFIYCSHTFISKICERFVLVFHNIDTFSYAILSVFLLIFQITVCIFAAELLRKVFPRFFRFINGGR